MKRFVPHDVSLEAHEIARLSPVHRENENSDSSIRPIERIPLPGSINPLNKYKKKSVYATEVNRIHFGQYTIDLTDVEQIRELEQTKAIMHALLYCDRFIDGRKNLKELFKQLGSDLERDGLDILSNQVTGNLAGFRLLELASAFNRLKTLRITHHE
jgi:hypothetical protein